MSTFITEKLFSYGTLQFEPVQIATFGRKLSGVHDTLPGYRLAALPITDEHVIKTSGLATHTIALFTGNGDDHIPGMVFDITPAELAEADGYEVSDYVRVRVTLHSGTDAWVYVGKQG